MKWDFTPEDVRNGKADYTIAEFKKDLFEEIKLNIVKNRGDEQTIQFQQISKCRIFDSHRSSFAFPCVNYRSALLIFP